MSVMSSFLWNFGQGYTKCCVAPLPLSTREIDATANLLVGNVKILS